jgi:hypothetical protein
MEESDRRVFLKLLGDAHSPEERAYLMKALAAGNSVGKVERFSALIHPHGGDPAWLADHLTPMVGGQDQSGMHFQGHGDARWRQGPHDDCVACATVMAHATVDPVYALQLSTGGDPENPQAAGAEAFGERLYREQARVHGETTGDFDPSPGDGVMPDLIPGMLDRELSPGTGVTYEHRPVAGEDDRRAVLTEIQRSVDQGKPVAIVGVNEKGDNPNLSEVYLPK